MSNRNNNNSSKSQPLPGLQLPKTLPKRRTAPPPGKRKPIPRFGERHDKSQGKPQKKRPPQSPPALAEWEKERPPLPPLPKYSRRDSRTQSRGRPSRSMSPRAKTFFNTFLAFIIFGGLVIMMGLRFFSYNALAVFLDDLHVGYIALSNELTSEEFHNDVVNHLEATYLTDVVVTQRVTIRPARRVSTRNINRDRSNMISQLGRNMNVLVVARAIYVNNNLEVLVRSENCVQQIENILINAWQTPYTIESTFTANWRTEPITISPDDERIRTPREAIYAMDRAEVVYHRHVVQSGESLYLLARLYNTTVSDLANLNNRTTAQPLLINEVLTVRTRRPLLSVQTVDEITTYYPIEIPVEVRESPYMAMSTRNIIQQGVAGEQRVSQRITRINGAVVSTETLEAVVTREPITEIAEEGTRPAVIERR